MASTEDYCLKWNDHHTTFFSSAENLCHAQALTDVTLSAGKREFTAHKLVLSVCSGYFSGLFAKASSRHDSRHAIVYLKDVEPRHMELLLSYMYRGEINVQESELYGLLATAKSLQIKGLTDSDEASSAPTAAAAPDGGGVGGQSKAVTHPRVPVSNVQVKSPTIMMAASTAAAAGPASSVLKPKLPPMNTTPTVKLARGNPLVALNSQNKRPAAAAMVIGVEQSGDAPKRVKEEHELAATAWGGGSAAAAAAAPSTAVNTTTHDDEFGDDDELDEFSEEENDGIGGTGAIDLPEGFGDSTVSETTKVASARWALVPH